MITAETIKKWIDGGETLRTEFTDYGLPEPTFKPAKGGMMITAYSTNYVKGLAGATDRVTEKVTEKGTETDQKTENVVEKLGESGMKTDRVGEKVGESGMKTENVAEKLGEKLGENRKLILILMQQAPYITIPEVVQKLNVSETAVQNNIKKLKTWGLLQRIGPDKGGYWKIVEKR